MFIKNTTKLDIIGGNISGLSFALECLEKKIPFTIHEKHIWDKPCGGGFGEELLDFLSEKAIKIQTNHVKTATFGNKYFDLENIPFDVKVAKRRHIQEQMMRAIPDEFVRMKQVTKDSVKSLSKLLIVATGINGFSKYLLQNNFTNLGRFQYSFYDEDTLKNWDYTHMYWYVIPEIQGYAWIFPSTEGDIDVGIGGMIPKNLDLHLRKFLTQVKRKYEVKIKASKRTKMRSWGIPMWDNTKPKKFFNYNREINKYCIGVGDAIESVQIVSAGGIENAIWTSISLAKSISKQNNGINLDLESYQRDLFTKLPLPSHTLAMKAIDKITKSNKLLNSVLATTIAGFPIVNRLFGRIFYLE